MENKRPPTRPKINFDATRKINLKEIVKKSDSSNDKKWDKETSAYLSIIATGIIGIVVTIVFYFGKSSPGNDIAENIEIHYPKTPLKRGRLSHLEPAVNPDIPKRESDHSNEERYTDITNPTEMNSYEPFYEEQLTEIQDIESFDQEGRYPASAPQEEMGEVEQEGSPLDNMLSTRRRYREELYQQKRLFYESQQLEPE